MARQHSTSLFDLVKSLSKSEKRYISMVGQIHFKGKNNKHLKLFSLIQQLESFDHELIKSEIYPEGLPKKSTFAELKNYLYNFILKTLVIFDERNSVSLKLRLGLQKLSVLYKRGLVKACKEMLTSLNKLARQADDQLMLLELQNWKRKIAHASFDVEVLSNKKNENKKICTDILKRIKTKLHLEELFSEVFVLRLQFANRIDGEEKAALEDLLKQIPKEIYETEVYEEKKLLLNILNFYNILIGDNESCHRNIKELFILIKSNKLDYKEKPTEVISFIDRLFYACTMLNRFEEGKSYLPEMLALTKSPLIGDLDKKRGVCSYYINSLIYHTYSGNFKAAQKTADEFLASYPKSYYQDYAIYFNCHFLNIYFAEGKYNEALDCIEKITSYGAKLRQDIKLYARCLEIIIHYELENYLFIKTLIRSTKRYLKKDFLLGFESLLIKLVKKLIASSYLKSEQLIHFQKFKKLLDDNVSPQSLNFGLVAYVVDNWVQSKVSKHSIKQIVKQKYDSFNQTGPTETVVVKQ